MDKYSRLEKIAELKDKGILSESEFKIEKDKILKDGHPAQSRQTQDAFPKPKGSNVSFSDSYNKLALFIKDLAGTSQKNPSLIIPFLISILLFIPVVFDSFLLSLLIAVVNLAAFLMFLISLSQGNKNAIFAISHFNDLLVQLKLLFSESINKNRCADQQNSLLIEKNQEIFPNQNGRNLVLVLTSLIVASFFLPWFSNGIISISGIGILDLGKLFSSCYLVIIVPLISVLAMIETVNPGLLPIPFGRLLPFLAGLSPYLLLILLYLVNVDTINNAISITSKVGSVLGGNNIASSFLSSAFNWFSIGFYLTMVSSGLLVIVSPKKSQVS